MLEQAHLIAPSRLPDGSTVWNDTSGDVGQVVTMLREYDPRLSLVRNNTEGRWEVWRQCEDEVRQCEAMLRRHRIPYLNSTRMSVEEIATRIMMEKELRGRK